MPWGRRFVSLTCFLKPWETQVWSQGQEDPLKEEMATHCSILVWKILWTEEPGLLQSMGSQSWIQWVTEHRRMYFFPYLKEPAATNSWAFCDFSVVNLIASWLSHLDSLSLSLFNDFIYLSMAVLSLHCYAGAFPNCGEQGLLSSWGAQTSHCGGFCCGPAWAQGHSGFSSCGLKVLEHRLNSSAYLAAASGIFLNQGLNPSLSHWQVDSLSLSHQGSLNSPFLGARSFTTCPSLPALKILLLLLPFQFSVILPVYL